MDETARLIQEQVELGEALLNRINPGAYMPGVFAELEAEYYGWTNYTKELLRSLFDGEQVADEFDPNFGVA